MTRPADDIVSDRFLIRRRVGAGGMGVVYEALDQRQDAVVALKTLRDLEPASILRLKGEFRSLAHISHPNLAALYELISEGNQWFFTMELIDGKDFLSYIRSDAKLPFAETATHDSNASEDSNGSRFTPQSSAADGPIAVLPAAQYGCLRDALRQLAEGLMALHKHNKLHRDIKPSNVLVTRTGRVVLLDFGLVTEKTAQQRGAGHPVGTFGFMAPEQAAGQTLSEASDWYSVGVMLFMALTGRFPHQPNPLQGFRETPEPPTPRDLCDSIPEDLNAICVRLMATEPARRLTGAELLRRLGSLPPERDSPRETSQQQDPFVGRERQLRQLTDALQQVEQRGEAVMVDLHGPSGHGKTVLMERFIEQVRQRSSAVVLSGRCYERESVPYKALDSLIDALSQHLVQLNRLDADKLTPRNAQALARLFPVLRRVETIGDAPRQGPETPNRQQLRRQAFGALRELLSLLGNRHLLVLLLDDVQWGDVDSALLLSSLLRSPASPRLLLIASHRSMEPGTSPFLEALASEFDRLAAPPPRVEVEVGALSREDARNLAQVLLRRQGKEDREMAETVARESAGNPFFIGEFLLYLRHHDRPREGELTLDRVLAQRIGQLPRAAKQLLEVVSVAGQPLAQQLAASAAELESEQQVATNMLTANHLVRTTGPNPLDTIEPYHDRIRETTVAHLSPGRRLDHHRLLAQVLEADGRADPETLAEHWEGANQPQRAGEYFAVAADQAAEALAFDRAADLYRAALERLSDGTAGGQQRRAQLADALANAGRGAEAAVEYQLAAEGAKAAERLELQRRGAMQALISGHIDQGLAALRQVLEQVGMRLAKSPAEALRGLIFRRLQLQMRGLRFKQRDESQIAPTTLSHIDICWSAAVGLSIVDTIHGATFQARNLLLSLQAGEPYRVSRALAWEAAHVITRGTAAAAQTNRLLVAAEKLAREIQEPHALGLIELSKGIQGYMLGHWRAARDHTIAAEQIFCERCKGAAWETDTAQSFYLWSLFFLGHVGQLSDRLPDVMKQAHERGDLYAETNAGTFVGYLTWLAADDPRGAHRDLERVMRRWSVQGFHVQHLTGLMAQTQIDLYQRDGQAAYQRLELLWPQLRSSLFLRVQVVRVFMRYLRARCLLAAAPPDAGGHVFRRRAAAEVRRIARERLFWARPLVSILRAGLADQQHDEAAVVAHLRDAIIGFQQADMELFAATGQRRLGELLGGNDESASLIQQADQWMATQSIRNPPRMTDQHIPWLQAVQ